MKVKWIFLMATMLLLIGTACKKDAVLPENVGLKLKSAQLNNVPIKGSLNVILDIKSFQKHPDELTPSPTWGPIVGTISHLGEIKEGSCWKATFYDKHEDVEPNYIDYIIEGKIVAANGDELKFTTTGKMYTGGVDDFNWIAPMIYKGGTGRFTNASGIISSTGILFFDGPIPTNVLMTIEGTITNVGQSK